ncbi:MAG TPA: sensor histidine kinase [Caulobacteraceae bacterium]|jgi:two-component sensor histidine kinase|nr:sensor histidine kinase [Caulobacteraceae bacterium]
MRPGFAARPIWPPTIRLRLGAALALALAPVLVLGMLEAGLAFQREAQIERTNLTAAAERSAGLARARIESAQVLLQTLAPGLVGFQCASRLSDVAARLKGYENLIRFDADGRFVCAAAGAPADPQRSTRPWFVALANGAPMVFASNPGVVYASDPSLLAAVRAEDAQGHFDGALTAVMSLASLRPDVSDPSLPPGAEVALSDAGGHWLSSTDFARFPQTPSVVLGGAPSELWLQTDRQGESRLYAAAPLVGKDVFVVISAPTQGLISWAWLNPVTSLALPLLAFLLALIAVWIVAERGVVRWIAYLQRIAAIYARGRFSVHPLQAERAPPEFRDLADTLDAMAATIVARDAALKEHLAQKDAMLLEIHHRVKNNLQIISSLLNMQQRALTDPAAREAISDTRQRITALALIYRALYQSPDLRRVDLREFLEELVGQLVTGDGGQRLARTELACDPLVIDPDRLAPIGLFAVEAISNACKHGLEEGGELNIAFRVQDDRGELTVVDSGRKGRTPKLGAGVGRTLMTAYARQLHGEAVFDANPGGGLTARLCFPIPAEVAGTQENPERIRALSPEAVR